MLQGISTFGSQILNKNQYWTLLSEVNQLHVTSRVKYIQLLEVLKSKGVAFKDIKSHLLNQAKDAGLYRKSMYNVKLGKMDYPTAKNLSGLAWHKALDNFMKFTSKNFIDYGKAPRKEATTAKKPVPKGAVITKTKVDGKVVSVKEQEFTGATTEDIKKGSNSEGSSIVAPLDSELSPEQVMSIIKDNWSVLGDFANSHSKEAGDAFIALLEALNK